MKLLTMFLIALSCFACKAQFTNSIPVNTHTGNLKDTTPTDTVPAIMELIDTTQLWSQFDRHAFIRCFDTAGNYVTVPGSWMHNSFFILGYVVYGEAKTLDNLSYTKLINYLDTHKVPLDLHTYVVWRFMDLRTKDFSDDIEK